MSASKVLKTSLLSAIAMSGFCAVSANASPFVVNLNDDFSANAASFSYQNSTFTFSGTGDYFSPVAIQTAGGAEISAFGGFLGIPVSPSSSFPGRGSGVITYGPTDQFASFGTATVVPFSTGDNYFGLKATNGTNSYFGYAYTNDSTLRSFAFETVAGTPITIDTNVAAVPESATWAMMLGGIGMTGVALRRRKKVTVSKVRFA